MPTDLPNILTISRIAAIPLLVLLVASHFPAADLGACLVFSAAAITDYYDGKLARSRRQQSDLGRMLDPIADKLLVGAALMMLVGQKRLRPGAVSRHRHHAARNPGQRAAGIPRRHPHRPAGDAAGQVEDRLPDGRAGYVAGGQHRREFLHLGFLPVSAIGEGMLWVAAGLTLWTGWDYLTAGWRHATVATAVAEAPVAIVRVLGGILSEGPWYRRLVRQRQNHVADRLAAASAGARLDGVHRQARHHGFDMDRPGKDTFRHREAGALEVLVASNTRWALLHEVGGTEPTLPELLARMQPVDLVLVEGFKTHPFAKLEVYRPVLGKPPIWHSNPDVAAVATDAPLASCDRTLLPLNDPAAVTAWLLQFLALERYIL